MSIIERRKLTHLWILEFSLINTLLWSLTKAQLPSSYQFGSNPYTQDSQPSEQQQTIAFKSPLLRTVFSRLESPQPNDSSNDGFPTNSSPIKAASFLNSFMQHLETRRSANQSLEYQANHLELIIRDGSANVVNIEFDRRTDRQQEWNSIIDLLADSLAFVIQEAERLGYQPNFKYSVDLNDGGLLPAFAPGLSAQALKSAAG